VNSRRNNDAADAAAVVGIGCVLALVYIVGWLLFIAAVCLIVKAIFF